LSFAVFTLGGRSVIAIPLDKSLPILRASIAALPAYTLKRKVFKRIALGWASALWLGRRLGLSLGKALQPADQVLVERIRDFCPGAAAVVPIWSLVPGRARSYFRIFDSATREIAFAKVSTAEPGRTRLQVEAGALQANANAKTFNCPLLLGLDIVADAVLLLTTALPPGSRLLHAEVVSFPHDIRDEIRSCTFTSTIDRVKRTDWYRRGLEVNAANPGLVKDLVAIEPATSVSLGPAHGDFGSENFFADLAGRIFLIDWEHYCAEAPVLTDEVGFWIGSHSRAIKTGKPRIAEDFAQAFMGHSNTDLLLALVYLSAFDVNDAKRLVALWKN
jgi:hypothetical protein